MGMFVVASPSNHNHHLSDHAHNATAATATALGVGVIPLLTPTPCLTAVEEGTSTVAAGNRGGNSSIQFWQTPQSYFKKTIITSDHHGFGGGGSDVGGGGLASTLSGTSTTMTCQDCGNQAKKDCNHRRCRTCCKSRGFNCATHVKSTWVPASRRRQRQLIASAAGGGGGGAVAGSSASTSSATKKPRLITSRTTTTTSHTSTSNTTPPRSFDTSSSHRQDASFMKSLPAQVRAPAVFKCVRVTAVEDGVDDEYAYQACVTIGGHVFKGFLYDQGVEIQTTRDQTNNIHNLSELHLGGGGRGRNVGGSLASSSPVDPRVVYGFSGSGLLSGRH